MIGTFYTKSTRSLWTRVDRKYCRKCKYGLVTNETVCMCCGNMYAYKPRMSSAKRRFNETNFAHRY